MKEKEKARKTKSSNRTSAGIPQLLQKIDTRTSLKQAGVGLFANDTGSRRTLKEGKSEKLVKTPANSNKLADNSTVAGISNIGDMSAAKSLNKQTNSNSPLET